MYRQFVAFTVIVIAVAVCFWATYRIAYRAAAVQVVFPARDCTSLIDSYGTYLETYAIQDYTYTVSYPGKVSTGCLQCYCDQQLALDPNFAGPLSGASFGNVPICTTYGNVMLKVLFWTNALSYIIIGLNYFLREACIALINWIGYQTETERLEKTTMLTFYVLFLNTAILLLMVNANMEAQPITLGLNGAMSDFSSNWFRLVGNIFRSTMVFNAYYPILEFVLYFAMRLVYRMMDSCRLDKYETKTKTIKAYLDIKLGPQYLMHFKYSSVLNIVFVTFMYGFGIPELFPIAAVSFIIIYILEQASFYYSYKAPPMYDERLSQSVLSHLMWAPAFGLCFAYWMASSNQLYSNEKLAQITTMSETFQADHLAQSVFQPKGWAAPAWPLLLTLCVVLFIIFFGPAFMRLLAKKFEGLIIGDIEIDEDIDNYWKTIDDNDREWSLLEEKNCRKNLGGLKIMTDYSYDKLKTVRTEAKKTLQGVHSYDILANPNYLEAFQYISASTEDRADFIVDDDEDESNDAAQSDLVRAVLGLAFIHKPKNFKFTPAALTELRREHDARHGKASNGANLIN